MEERFMIAQPIGTMQYMLGALAQVHDSLPFVAIDGVFGEETLEAVMTFQREFCRPVTGRVDQRTWDAIVEQYRRLRAVRAQPRRLYGFPDRPFRVLPGQTSQTMALVQIMLRSLSDVLEGIVPDEADGVHGEGSVENTRWLQRCARMEQTGVMDRFAWDVLSRLYDLFIVRREGLEET